MTTVVVKKGQDITRVLKSFKKKCMKDGILKFYKRAQRFEKPSDRRRRERARARKKAIKLAQRSSSARYSRRSSRGRRRSGR